jgi:drug/metabolite transporter (DMT)-like permease
MAVVAAPGAARVNHPVQGVGLLLLAVSCFAAMDTTVGWLGRRLPSLLLMLWVRYGMQAMVMAVWVLVDARRSGQPRPFATAHPRFQAARGVLLLFSSALTFLGLQHMPVPELTAINMLGPVLVTVLAAWLLKEHVSVPRRWLLAGGFVGALIIIRPGSGLFGWAVLLPLGSTLAYAFFQLLTTKLTATESPMVTNFYTGLTGTALLTVGVLATGVDVLGMLRSQPALHLGLLAAIGLLGTVGHLLLILALTRTSTGTLMPLLYVQIGAATLLAWWVFGHLPDLWAWVGMCVIALCGAANTWLSLRGRQAAALQADTVPD